MKDQKSLTAVMLAGGVVALALRLWQQMSGFEADTGLAVPGHPAGTALAAVLGVVALALLMLRRKLPGEKDGRAFEQVFATESAARLTLVVMGVFLMAGAGALQVLFAVMGGGLESVIQGDGMVAVVWMGSVSPRELLILGVMAVVSAVSLFPAVAACRHGKLNTGSFNGNCLLIPVICMVVRLVMLYRIDSVNPVLQAYYVELLAVVLAAMAFYQLAGFAFGQGAPRWYGLCSGLAVVLCMTTLGDAHDVSGTLFYAGCALSVLGFWLLYGQETALPEA